MAFCKALTTQGLLSTCKIPTHKQVIRWESYTELTFPWSKSWMLWKDSSSISKIQECKKGKQSLNSSIAISWISLNCWNALSSKCKAPISRTTIENSTISSSTSLFRWFHFLTTSLKIYINASSSKTVTQNHKKQNENKEEIASWWASNI